MEVTDAATTMASSQPREWVIETLRDGQRDPEYQRMSTDRLTIGRGWQSDILVTDPSVCAQHATLELSGDSIRLIDHNSVNGTYLGDKKARRVSGTELIATEQWIRIGHTLLRLHDPNAEVAPTVAKSRLDFLIQKMQSAELAIITSVLATLISVFLAYQSSVTQIAWSEWFRDGISTQAGLILTALVLSGVAKLLRNEFRFWPHLLLSSMALIGIHLIDLLTGYISFNSLSASLVKFVDEALLVAVMSAWLFLVLHLCSRLSNRGVWVTTLCCALLYGITVQILPTLKDDRSVARNDLVTTSKPKSWLLHGSTSRQDFIMDIEGTFERASKKAAEANDK